MSADLSAAGTPLHLVPTLAELADDPTRIAGLPAGLAGDLLADCERDLVRLARVRDGLLIRVAIGNVAAHGDPRDDLFDDIEEAANLIGRASSFIYRNHRTLPFVIQEGRGRRLRFSRTAIARFLDHNRGDASVPRDPVLP